MNGGKVGGTMRSSAPRALVTAVGRFGEIAVLAQQVERVHTRPSVDAAPVGFDGECDAHTRSLRCARRRRNKIALLRVVDSRSTGGPLPRGHVSLRSHKRSRTCRAARSNPVMTKRDRPPWRRGRRDTPLIRSATPTCPSSLAEVNRYGKVINGAPVALTRSSPDARKRATCISASQPSTTEAQA
jgi:hypothetical protein